MFFLILLSLTSLQARTRTEPVERSVSKEFTLIGVIHETKSEKSLAMVREASSKNAFTVRIGDVLPNHPGFFVIEINKGFITASDGVKRLIILSDYSNIPDAPETLPQLELDPAPSDETQPDDMMRPMSDDYVTGMESIERYIRELNAT